jgi:hypothetical protein
MLLPSAGFLLDGEGVAVMRCAPVGEGAAVEEAAAVAGLAVLALNGAGCGVPGCLTSAAGGADCCASGNAFPIEFAAIDGNLDALSQGILCGTSGGISRYLGEQQGGTLDAFSATERCGHYLLT